MRNRRLILRLCLSITVVAGVVAASGGLDALGASKTSLSFTTASQTTAAGQSSGVITVSLSSGLTGPATVKLTTSSATGVFRDQADSTNVTSVSIPSAQTQAFFRYRDTTAGTPTITAVAASTSSPKQWTGNLSGTQTETVTATTLDHLGLAPASATVTSGQTQSYSATGFDRYGNSNGNVTAQTTFTITPDGSCQGASCQAKKAGAHTVIGTDGTAGGQASLTVTAGVLDHLVISPKTASISAGAAQAYSAEGFDAAGNDLGNVTAQTTFTISPDGSCVGTSCSASGAGAHTVTGTDGTASGQASVTVTAGALDHLVIAPKTESVTAGEPQAYSAEGYDQYGNDLGDVTAQTTFTISPDGSCVSSSCSATNAGAHTVTATDGTASGQASLTVTAGALDHLVISPKTATITAGASQAFAAEGFDRYGNDLGDVTVLTTFTISPDGSCIGTSCSASSAGAHTVTATDGTASGQASLTVTAGALDHLVISPKTGLVAVGEPQTYSAEGFDQYENDLGSVTTQTTFAIGPDGSCVGSSCSATSAGAHTVTATDGTASGQASLTVTVGRLDHIVISPKTESITAGESQTYTAEGFDAAGNDLGDVTAQTTFTIAPDGTCQEATCRAQKAGTHTVTATDGGVSDQATLSVVVGTLDHLVVSPETASFTAGGSQAYTAEGFDAAGNDLGDVTAQTTFTIAPDGFCVGNSCGSSRSGAHIVTGTNGTAAGEASLTVIVGPLDHIAISPKTGSIAAGGSQAYTAEGFDAAGNDLGDVTAQTTFTISPDGMCQGATCRSTSAGSHTVTATDGSSTDTAQLTITPGPFNHLVISPKTPTITAGASQTFTADGFDQYGNDLGDVTSSATFAIGPNGSCQENVCSATKPGEDTVTASEGESSDSTQMTVQAGPLDHIAISPKTGSIAVGESQSYSAEGFDAAGNDLGDVTAQTTFTIVPDGSCQGAVCTPTAGGSHTVAATDGSAIDHATLQAQSAPATTVSLTFDDGTSDQTQAGQIMAQHSMPGTFFIITGRVGTSGNLGLSDLNTLAAAGDEIGDHTVSHLNLLTVSPEEAERQVCNARVQLENWGFHVWDFAYPQGGTNAQLEQIVQNCHLNSARVVGNIVSPGDCFGCPYAESMPPRDPYAIATPDSIKSTNTLQDLENYVIQAQQHGGGWVPLVFHHICNGCDPDSVSPTIFSSFLDWLGTQSGNGVTVKTMHEVIGGADLPPLTGPPPPPPSGDLIQDSSLEADLNGDGLPDCWTVAGSGTNTWSAHMTPDANTGNFAEQVSISDFTSGDRRLVPTQDLGQCAPPATAGHTYTASAYLKGEGTMKWVAYYRDSQGAWNYWTQSAVINVSSSYAQASWTTPAVPSGATAVSVGISLRSVGTFTSDDFYLKDNGASDQAPPVVSLTAPTAGASVIGTAVYITAQATDNVGVTSVKFLLDGTVLGSKTAPTTTGGSTYQWKWDSSTVSPGQHTLTAIASDAAGNQTTSTPVTVTVVQDTTPPVTSILCNGSTTCAAWYKAPITVTLKATDNVAVAHTYYTTDGTEPSASNGTLYTVAFSVGQTATVKYRSVDTAGNWEQVESQMLQVDTQPPPAQITAPSAGATVSGTAVYITAQATDNVSVTSVRFFLDGVSLGSKTAPTSAGGSSYQWKWDSTTATKGTHTLTVVATDQAGNQTTSPPIQVTVG
jgi:peptidoglycan/xylan/chitin deacetylase (PgdA/CDA1 family)